LRSEGRSRIEYLMPTNNIIILDSHFNLMNKSNLTDRLYYDLIRFFLLFGIGLLFGPPCIYIYTCVLININSREREGSVSETITLAPNLICYFIVPLQVG